MATVKIRTLVGAIAIIGITTIIPVGEEILINLLVRIILQMAVETTIRLRMMTRGIINRMRTAIPTLAITEITQKIQTMPGGQTTMALATTVAPLHGNLEMVPMRTRMAAEETLAGATISQTIHPGEDQVAGVVTNLTTEAAEIQAGTIISQITSTIQAKETPKVGASRIIQHHGA